MNQENPPFQISKIYEILKARNISTDTIKLYRENGDITTYLIESNPS